jgi:F0F1-type ATP synthase assembly protein I
MSQHPANLLLRFVLEIISLVVVGQWGWQQSAGPLRYVLAFGLPVLLAVIWGVFRDEGDPIQTKKPPVVVSGRVRLALELVFFAIAIYSAFASRPAVFGWSFLFVLLLHHIWSLDRLERMLRRS